MNLIFCVLHNTFAHLIHFSKMLFPVKILKLLRIFVSSEKWRCLHQVKFYKFQWKGAHSNDHSLDICLAVCLCDKLGGTLVVQKSLLPRDLGLLMDKEIPCLQNCIDSIISEEDLSYLMFCQLVFHWTVLLQTSCGTVCYSGGFAIIDVCWINYGMWVSIIFQ